MPYIILALITSLGSSLFLLNKTLDLRHELEEKDAIIEVLQSRAKESADKILEQSRENAEISKQYNEAANQLDSFRAREAVVLAKPGLVEIKLNKAYKKQQKTYACITGGTLCD